MRKKLSLLFAVIFTLVMIVGGCNKNQKSKVEAATDSDTQTGTVVNTSSSRIAESKVKVDTDFTANDLDIGYEDSTATHIELNGNEIKVDGEGTKVENLILTISKKGEYVISGTLTNGQIIINAGNSDKVHLILNGVSITNDNNAPIYIKNADKVFITLKEGTKNTLSDGTSYVQTDDDNVDGVIFSRADLTINGNGQLDITGNYKHGIVSKDDLIITGGIYHITAIKDDLNGKDCVKIKAGTFKLLAASGNGIQSKNSEDDIKGFVYIEGGDITITNSKEGIEGTAIVVAGGTIAIKAEDDGINAASGNTSGNQEGTGPDANDFPKPNITNNNPADTSDTQLNKTDATSSASLKEMPSDFPTDRGQRKPEQGGFGGGGFENDTNCYILITGGTITIDALGDGIDSNGSIIITGGNMMVSGPTDNGNGALDYNGTADISGGTVVFAGSSGMAQGFSESSTQYSFLYNLTTVCEAGTEIKLTDNDGNTIISYTPNKQYQSVVISTPKLRGEAAYHITFGSQKEEITLTSITSSFGKQSTEGFRGPKDQKIFGDLQDNSDKRDTVNNTDK